MANMFRKLSNDKIKYLYENLKDQYPTDISLLLEKEYKLRALSNVAYCDSTTSNSFNIIDKQKHKTNLFLLIITILIAFLACVGLYTLIFGNAVEKKTTVSTKTTNSTSVEKTASVSYVGSKNSDKYHLPSCKWAAKIKKSNKITFNSESKAHAKGYSPCKTCID
jgi:hypothetical protein